MRLFGNFRILGPTLRRFYFIYRKLLGADRTMRNLLERDLGVSVDDIRFSGLPFDMYYSLLFGIYATVAHSAKARPFPTSILDLDDLATRLGLRETDVVTFMSEHAGTEGDTKSLIGALDSIDIFTTRVTESRWASDFRLFRNRPLLRLNDGRFLVLDLQFLFESASRGLYWSILHRLSATGQKLFPSLWGGLFETYVQHLIRHYYPDVRVNVLFDGGEVDAVLRLPNGVLIIEIKSGFVPQDAKGSRDQTTFSKAVENKFVLNRQGKPKGVSQLACAIQAIRTGKFPGVTPGDAGYPVLISEDPLLQTFAMNTYLDRTFTDRMGDTTNRLNVLTVDELEAVLPYLRAGDLAVTEMFDSRVVEGKMTPECVNSTFYTIASRGRFPTRPETFLMHQGDELTAILDEKYSSFKQQL